MDEASVRGWVEPSLAAAALALVLAMPGVGVMWLERHFLSMPHPVLCVLSSPWLTLLSLPALALAARSWSPYRRYPAAFLAPLALHAALLAANAAAVPRLRPFGLVAWGTLRSVSLSDDRARIAVVFRPKQPWCRLALYEGAVLSPVLLQVDTGCCDSAVEWTDEGAYLTNGSATRVSCESTHLVCEGDPPLYGQ